MAAATKIVEKVDGEIEHQMPAPHPSIVYSPENDADGLQWQFPPAKPEAHIWSRYIEGELCKVEYMEVRWADAARMQELGVPLPVLTEERAALRDRLEARMKLSEDYEEQKTWLRKQLRWPELIKRQEKISSREAAIEARIEAARPMTRADLELKLAMYDNNSHEVFADYLIRDFRRLLDQPQAYAMVRS